MNAMLKRINVFLSFVYRDPIVKLKNLVWKRLIRIDPQRSESWPMVNFNKPTENHEKKRGNLCDQQHPLYRSIPWFAIVAYWDLGAQGTNCSGVDRGINKQLDANLIESWEMKNDTFYIHYNVKYLKMIWSVIDQS